MSTTELLSGRRSNICPFDLELKRPRQYQRRLEFTEGSCECLCQLTPLTASQRICRQPRWEPLAAALPRRPWICVLTLVHHQELRKVWRVVGGTIRTTPTVQRRRREISADSLLTLFLPFIPSHSMETVLNMLLKNKSFTTWWLSSAVSKVWIEYQKVCSKGNTLELWFAGIITQWFRWS